MNQCIVLSAIGNDRPGIVSELSGDINKWGGNIADSRMTVLGGEFALILLVEGSESAIKEIEQNIDDLQQRLSLTIICRRTGRGGPKQSGVPYAIEVVAMDHPGIVSDIARFLSSRGINIQDMDTHSYAAAHTGTPMFALTMTVSIPADQSIAVLRQAFKSYCDDLNMDATLEPLRE
ncbi:MAG: ACT domain-containing protein [Gammaproteobacteria bacterium]|nr:ACT domain-containing protein [Gammaproteobacteria bacterium]